MCWWAKDKFAQYCEGCIDEKKWAEENAEKSRGEMKRADGQRGKGEGGLS